MSSVRRSRLIDWLFIGATILYRHPINLSLLFDDSHQMMRNICSRAVWPARGWPPTTNKFRPIYTRFGHILLPHRIHCCPGLVTPNPRAIVFYAFGPRSVSKLKGTVFRGRQPVGRLPRLVRWQGECIQKSSSVTVASPRLCPGMDRYSGEGTPTTDVCLLG